MTWLTLQLILTSVMLTACAQIALKAGVGSPAVQQAMGGSPSAGLQQAGAAAIGLLSSPMIAVGLLLYLTSTLLWLMVLARIEVSSAYPFAALGIVLTAILGRLVFGEAFSAAKIMGTFLIVGGVAILARG